MTASEALHLLKDKARYILPEHDASWKGEDGNAPPPSRFLFLPEEDYQRLIQLLESIEK